MSLPGIAEREQARVRDENDGSQIIGQTLISTSPLCSPRICSAHNSRYVVHYITLTTYMVHVSSRHITLMAHLHRSPALATNCIGCHDAHESLVARNRCLVDILFQSRVSKVWSHLPGSQPCRVPPRCGFRRPVYIVMIQTSMISICTSTLLSHVFASAASRSLWADANPWFLPNTEIYWHTVQTSK
jgi:hypothetical protein